MKSTLFAAVAILAASVSAMPYKPSKDCKSPFPNISCKPLSLQNYTIVSGDTLTTIADKFGSGACNIVAANNIANPDLIFPGQLITVPANCTETIDKTSCLPNVLQPTGTQDCVKGLSVNPPTYQVIPGDTFTLIANNFDLKLDALKNANQGRFASFDAIFAGNTTIIPVCQGCSCTNRNYTIVSGDTFSAIAKKGGITIGQIEAANPGQLPQSLQIGQVINNPVCSCVA
ncbi:carbohydrate-binding module family 50 protein [Bipolaris oryzae ATCC 44560]|uniref:Carbohydrate-binding module family 50 protein n=1 Tax=Bipolaris oryzae ATCC 44560 TaxID=930090 RepID=W6ZMC0_COCMI|nr:carbohydrate-binding module family 50 protein [Bipolaris oryzae ATCC 44560]EUC44726.1 carbohydrate-binding module family 50 protein [Bipolaris oryzae ATCC 44560]